MKNIKNKSNLSVMAILFALIFLNSSSLLNAQNESFITMKDGKFHNGCEEFYPMIMNYPLRMEDSAGIFRLTPNMKYCNIVSGNHSCGQDIEDYQDTIIEHLQVIESMGFNMIRVSGLRVEIRIDSLEVAHLYSPEHYRQGTNNFQYHHNKKYFEIEDSTDYKILGDALATLFNILRKEEIDLRVILIAGGHGVELVDDEYSDYLAYIADRFKDEPLLFAYDLYNEPEFSDSIKNTEYTKYDYADWFAYWYNTIKENTSTQYVTYGPVISDFFNWDPGVLHTDFVAYHTYSHSKVNYNWNHDTAFIAYKVFLEYANNVLTKDWIIGETGYPGMDTSTQSGISIHPVVGSLDDQENYLEDALKYVKWYGIDGYGHWDLKDNFHSYNLGLYETKKYFKGLIHFMDGDNYNWKDAAYVYQNFDPSVNCTTCTHPSEEDYYNSSFFEYGLDTAMIVDTLTEDPIENALIVAKLGIPDTNLYDHECITFTDSTGVFIIRKAYEDTNIIIKNVKIGGPNVSFHYEDLDISGLGSDTYYLKTIIPDSLPEIPEYNVLDFKTGDTVVWDIPKTINNNIEIDSGAHLTINTNVYFNESLKLIVKRGATLILDSAKLTNNGNSCLWEGIELWGTKNKHSDSLLAHGQVIMKNSSVIENARYGIRGVKMIESQGGSGGGSEASPDYDYAGGKVFAYGGSKFSNCVFGIYLYPYTYDHDSYIDDVIFETTDSLLTSTGEPHSFIYLSGTQGIGITGCTFKNSRASSETADDERGNGIYSSDSYFKVDEGCTIISSNCPDSLLAPCRFEGLTYGINAKFTVSTKYIDVRNSEFIENWRSLYASAMSNGRITSNDFEIDQPFEEDGGCGLYLDNCTGYWVEDNYFEHDGDSVKGIGIVVHNSGSDANEIYLNEFYNLEKGISAQELNKGRSTGLQILCNNFKDCEADILVPEPSASMRGIARSQGINDTLAEAMAGNLFYIEDILPDEDYDDLENQAETFYYYYPSNPGFGYDRAIPVDFTENTVYEFGIEITSSLTWEYSDGCPSQITTGGGYKTTELENKELYQYYSMKVSEVESVLSELIDDGNTDQLNSGVGLSTPPEALQTYNDLIDIAPFVSDTVIGTTIEKEDVLPNAMVRDIMVANPHSAVNDELLGKLSERNTPMPDYMKAQVLQAGKTKSMKMELESKLAGLKSKQKKALSGIFREYLKDTLNPGSSFDSLTNMLETIQERKIKYDLALLYLQNGDFIEGSLVLSDIPSMFELTPIETAEHIDMVNYYSILKDIFINNRTIQEVSVAETEQLISLAQSGSGIVKSYARNLLIDLDKMEYTAPIQIPDKFKSSKKIEDYRRLINSTPPKQIRVFPNPSSDFVIIHYSLDTENAATIKIIDINGKVKDHLNINHLQNQVTLKTKDWTPGIYVATILIDGKPIESCKFTVVK